VRPGLIALGLFAVTTLAAQAASIPSLSWARAFPVNQAPIDVHFIARYADAQGQPHRLEAWRHGDDFLHRKTDAALNLYLVGADSQARYRLIDHRRHLSVDVTRVNLYRIGAFSSAFGLAHVLDPSLTPYRIEPATVATQVASRLGGCRWRRLHNDAAKSDTLVCWSSHWGLPLSILDTTTHRPVFEITAVDAKPLKSTERTLPPPQPGYARVDADDDIDPRAD